MRSSHVSGLRELPREVGMAGRARQQSVDINHKVHQRKFTASDGICNNRTPVCSPRMDGCEWCGICCIYGTPVVNRCGSSFFACTSCVFGIDANLEYAVAYAGFILGVT